MARGGSSAVGRRELLSWGVGAIAVAACGVRTGADEDAAEALSTDWSGLRSALTGKLRIATDVGYDATRITYNSLFDGRRPAAVASVASADDVKACIEFARTHGVPIAARSGGHSYAGYSQPDGALVVDLRGMKSVAVASDGTTVVGSGARLMDVYNGIAAAGRCIPGGSCPTVGVGGVTLGGGIGVLARLHGLTCDTLVRADVVLADGTEKTVDAANDPELFWALRGGGGGNFGIVTSFTYAAPRAPDAMLVFSLQFPTGSSAAVLGAWQTWIATLPNEAWSNCVVSAGSAPAIRVGGSFVGTQASLDALLDDLVRRAGTTPSARRSSSKSYLDAMRYFGGCSTKTYAQCHLSGESTEGQLGREAWVASSRMLEGPMSDPTKVTSLLSHYVGMDVLFDSLGGKVAELAADDTAFPHRSALASVQIYKGTTLAQKADATRQVGEVQAALATLVGGGTYINYIDPNQAGWARSSYKENLDKLQRVARTYDPGKLFAFAQSVNG